MVTTWLPKHRAFNETWLENPCPVLFAFSTRKVTDTIKETPEDDEGKSAFHFKHTKAILSV